MDLKRFLERLDATGADLSAWPERDRAGAERLMASEPDARRRWEQARRMDEAIGRALAHSTDTQDDTTAGRVLASLASSPLPRQRQPLLSRFWPTALLDLDLTPAWPRVAALACAGALGIALGLFAVNPSAFETRGSAAAAETDFAALVFDPEPVTGARP